MSSFINGMVLPNCQERKDLIKVTGLESMRFCHTHCPTKRINMAIFSVLPCFTGCTKHHEISSRSLLTGIHNSCISKSSNLTYRSGSSAVDSRQTKTSNGTISRLVSILFNPRDPESAAHKAQIQIKALTSKMHEKPWGQISLTRKQLSNSSCLLSRWWKSTMKAVHELGSQSFHPDMGFASLAN